MKSVGLIRRCLFGWLTLLFAVSLIPAARAAGDDELKSRVDALVQPLIDDGKVVGLAIGVIRGAETHVFSYGRLVQGGQNKPTGDTIFEIGAIGQAFTGLLLADMAERGLVRLDQRVEDLLPAAVSVPKFGDRAITLLDLVTHTSGLPRMPDNFKPKSKMNPHADYTVEQMYDFLSRHTLTRAPGEKYEYSNLGMGLLGHVLGLRAGLDYEELLKRRISEPLGLKQTTITLSEEQQKRFAQGYNARVKPTSQWDIPTFTGAGGHRSSVNDLLRFLRANIDPAGAPLENALRASHVQRFEKAYMPRLAMAWVFADIDSEDTLWLTGASGGFRSVAAFDPKLKIGVVVLANTASDETDKLGKQILALLSPAISGIGVGLGWRAEDAGYPTVKELFRGGPAAKSGGIAVGDRLVGIEDDKGKLIDFKEKDPRKVIAMIRGARGSSVRIVVEKNGERKVYKLIREIVGQVAQAPSSSKP
ncbi:MAG TPA: serine hydrolase [Candidatus Binatia bacterium]|jgi:CubicO group peptidase (beta-lactamase class C family)